MEKSNVKKTHTGAEKDLTVKGLVITAFFAAITYLGIQVFRIPMPAVIGTPFVHFGHIFVVMGVLLQGGKRGAVSGALGLVIFDLLNGYIQDIPQVFVETIVKALIVGAIFFWMKRKAEGNKAKEYQAAVICSVIYGIFNIVIELVAGTVKMVILGSGVSAAFAGSLASIPATVINALFMIIAIAILYKPVSVLYKRIA
ncbi:MAG: ECF transporter S component [Lachnospiraceae bacterium]